MFPLIWSLAQKILPLYLFIVLGFVAGRRLHIQKDSIANLLVYLILPVVIFHGAVTADIQIGLFALPVIMFSLAVITCLLSYYLAKKVWRDGTANLLAFIAGTGNTGYFGLPVAAALFGEASISIMVFGTMGMVLYESSVGYYIAARGQLTSRQALHKMLRLPLIYAFVIGLIVNQFVSDFSPAYTTFISQFYGAYTILGMMMIGLGLASIHRLEIDWKFLWSALGVKFIIWPVLIIAVVFADQQLFHWFNHEIQQVLLLLGVVPHAVNSINFASILNVHPEKAALVVTVSTTMAVIYIPVMISLFGLV